MSQTWTSVFQIQIAVLCGNCVLNLPMLNWSNSTGIIFQICDLCKRYEELSVTSLLCSAGILGQHYYNHIAETRNERCNTQKNQSNSLFINPSLIALRGNVCKVSFCLEWSANFTNLLNVVRAQNLCFFASTDAVVFDSKNGISFLLCSTLMDQGLVTLFTHLTRSIFQN